MSSQRSAAPKADSAEGKKEAAAAAVQKSSEKQEGQRQVNREDAKPVPRPREPNK